MFPCDCGCWATTVQSTAMLPMISNEACDVHHAGPLLLSKARNTRSDLGVGEPCWIEQDVRPETK